MNRPKRNITPIQNYSPEPDVKLVPLHGASLKATKDIIGTKRTFTQAFDQAEGSSQYCIAAKNNSKLAVLTSAIDDVNIDQLGRQPSYEGEEESYDDESAHIQLFDDQKAVLNNAGKDDSKTSGRWTKQEHLRFVEAIKRFGKDWRKVEDFIGTRSGAQIRSHAQKYFIRIEKELTSEHDQAELANETCQTNKGFAIFAQKVANCMPSTQREFQMVKAPSIGGMSGLTTTQQLDVRHDRTRSNSGDASTLPQFSNPLSDIVKSTSSARNLSFLIQCDFQKQFKDFMSRKQLIYDEIYRFDVDLQTEGKHILKKLNDLMFEAQSLTFRYLGSQNQQPVRFFIERMLIFFSDLSNYQKVLTDLLIGNESLPVNRQVLPPLASQIIIPQMRNNIIGSAFSAIGAGAFKPKSAQASPDQSDPAPEESVEIPSASEIGADGCILAQNQ